MTEEQIRAACQRFADAMLADDEKEGAAAATELLTDFLVNVSLIAKRLAQPGG